MSVQVEKWVFNVAEYHKMSEAGILSEDDRVELIEGEILKMSPIGSRHAACVKRLTTRLHRRVGQSVTISVQDPIHLNDYSEPEPDIALLKFRDDFYSPSLPTADDVELIIEVADTSMDYDRGTKLSLYAQAHIPEVWLVDLIGDTLEVYSEPRNGVYQKLRRAQQSEVLTPETLPWLTLIVDEVLG